jgi:hypothetical protein
MSNRSSTAMTTSLFGSDKRVFRHQLLVSFLQSPLLWSNAAREEPFWRVASGCR